MSGPPKKSQKHPHASKVAKPHSSKKNGVTPKVEKTIAVICVPLVGIIAGEDQGIADYINSFVAGSLLRYSRTFDQIRICTSSSMVEAFNYYFSGHHFEFQFRGKSFYFPLDRVISDSLVLDSQNQDDYKKINGSKDPKFFEYQFNSIKSDDNTTLFFLLFDHGDADVIDHISFSSILKWIDGIKFNHAVIMSDSCISGGLVDYIKLCDFVNKTPSFPKQVITSTGRIVRLVSEANLTTPNHGIQLLQNINITALVKFVFDQDVKELSIKLGTYSHLENKDIKQISVLAKKLKKVPDENITIENALPLMRIPVDADILSTLSALKSNEILTVKQLIDTNKIIKSLFPKTVDQSLFCDCSSFLLYLKKYKKKFDKECSNKLTTDMLEGILTDYLNDIPYFDMNLRLSHPELASYHKYTYDLVDKHIPACINKITVISSASSDNESKKFKLGTPGAIEFIAALCIENGKIKSVFDRYLSELSTLNDHQQVPQFFSIDQWFYNADISGTIPLAYSYSFKSSQYSQKFVELLNQVGFSDKVPKPVAPPKKKKAPARGSKKGKSSKSISKINKPVEPNAKSYEEEESDPLNDPMARLKAIPRYSIEGYVPKHKESLKLPSSRDPQSRGRDIAVEFVHFFNWILAKEGFPEYQFYLKVTRDTVEEQDIYEDYLYFESDIKAGVICIPFFWKIRRSLSLYLHKHKDDKKDPDVYEVYKKTCYSFNDVVDKYFPHENKLIYNH